MFGVIKKLLLRAVPASVAGRLRVWRTLRGVRRFPKQIVEHNYGGGRLKVCLADSLARGWYDNDWAELPEIAELRKGELRPGARVFDIGAHQGIVAMMLARETGPAGQVVAVEPMPHNVASAVTNFELNGFRQIVPVQAAISDRPGTLILNQNMNSQIDDGTGAWGRIAVESVTIDGLAKRFGAPNVVFLDVEGAEQMALAGARSVLDGHVDFFVEVHVDCGLEKLGGSVDGVLKYFTKERFSLYVRSDDHAEFRPFVNDDPIMKSRFFLLARALNPPANGASTNN